MSSNELTALHAHRNELRATVLGIQYELSCAREDADQQWAEDCQQQISELNGQICDIDTQIGVIETPKV